MTAEIVNLRKARKAMVRRNKEQTSAANRAAFGRSKAQRHLEAMEKERARQVLDSAQRASKPAAEPAAEDE